ncbi:MULTISPECIES: Fe(3+) ABC transporter substrate-binding protein [unclassified Methylophaga]|uniref:Fe(3+) ABC transporter substrate-binding protein n=1 Tax=unclassified Methylophaga TaxID=2629249 RepID=UPI000C92C4ED|nr:MULTISPECIES: Fe(3+) ABC transporter substrate-binding protein [unclassified Methylophaga]MBN45924.1 Fe(3+) ABC transporter substrate-binding protein [Methylophaga sp.]|tara:strand:- start:114682 stop:115713 length:1032 start_codon:yes stop_codon:yes gene_type:complete
MRKAGIFLSVWLGLSVLLVTGCSSDSHDEVNLYSARIESLIKPLLDDFTEETGIKVNLVTGNADELLQRLQNEGRNTPADILLTTDAGRLHRAMEMELIQPVESDTLKQRIPSSYRHPEDYWFGLSLRARPIMYVKDRVYPAELSTYEALVEPRWNNRICVRSSSNIYNQSMVASMIVANGEAATEDWAKGLVANFARSPQGGDRDQINAAAAGQCDIVIANTYYLAGMLTSNDPKEREAAEKMGVFWPNQDDRGVHINVSGAAVIKDARHQENAIRLIEFLTSDAAQKWYAEANGEYPVRADIEKGELLEQWGEFKADPLVMDKLGEFNADALRLMDRAGWQ